MKIGVCIRAKNEHKIICDWVKHYLDLGFDKIFIYDNLSEPSIETTLLDKNLLTDKVFIKIDTFPHSGQSVVYQETLNNNKDFDWILFCDADEFLWVKEGTIKDFLSKFTNETCTVLINWIVYGTSNLKTYDRNKTVFEQFTRREQYSHFWNTFVKSFVRPNLIEKIGTVHITTNKKYKAKNIYRETVNVSKEGKCDNRDMKLSNNSPVVLVHYMTLDFESMLEKYKRNREGWLIRQTDNKYSLAWYKTDKYGFKDDVEDLRMIKNNTTNNASNNASNTVLKEEKTTNNPTNNVVKKKIYFVINNSNNHKSVIDAGLGASEFLFFKTANELTKHYDVVVYNRDTDAKKMDDVEYRFLPPTLNPNIENINNSVVIVQRHFEIAINLHKINSSNKYILWSHDYLSGEFPNLAGEYSRKEINHYYTVNKIKVVSVSQYHARNIKQRLLSVNITTIYNALFPQYLPRDSTIPYDKNKIIFASSWAKGLTNVLKISTEYYKKNKEFKLVLIQPIYCNWNPDLKQYPFIEKVGCIKDKSEYSKLLQGCLCVLSTTFPETFGCVFAECLHLGVPVIGDTTIPCGFLEFIPREHTCKFGNTRDVIRIIERFRDNRPCVKLDSKFYIDSVTKEWIKLLES